MERLLPSKRRKTSQNNQMLLPTSANSISQNYQTQSQQQARSMLDNAKAMANDYLQGMKQMAGGQASQPMRTMAKEQMDIDNALNKVSAYSNLSGKVPEMDYLKQVGLQNTLGPIAGKPTYQAQLDNMGWAYKNRSGSGNDLAGDETNINNNGIPDSFDSDLIAAKNAIANGEMNVTDILKEVKDVYNNGDMSDAEYNLWIKELRSIFDDGIKPIRPTFNQLFPVSGRTISDNLLQELKPVQPSPVSFLNLIK